MYIILSFWSHANTEGMQATENNQESLLSIIYKLHFAHAIDYIISNDGNLLCTSSSHRYNCPDNNNSNNKIHWEIGLFKHYGKCE